MIYKLSITVETGFAGCNYDTTIDVDMADDATEEEREKIFEEEARDYFFNCCSYGYSATPSKDATERTYNKA